MRRLYRSRAASRVTACSHAEILALFEGVDLVEPGLVHVPLWRPGRRDPVPANPSEYRVHAGVGRKRP
ncbi:SAM-dependent methyltransferase [Streptomyces sp. NPDC003710]